MTHQMKTVSGLNFYLVSSAFQKFIRRGMEHEAMFYGTELYLSNYEEYAWFRMMVMASEDVGLANPDLIVQVRALYDTYAHFKAKGNKHQPERLPFTNALLLLIRSKKSRLVDNKLCYYFELRETIKPPEFPDFVFDMHTYQGKAKGRGNDHFFEEAGRIENVNLDAVPDEFDYRDMIQGMYRVKDAAAKKAPAKPSQAPTLFQQPNNEDDYEDE